MDTKLGESMGIRGNSKREEGDPESIAECGRAGKAGKRDGGEWMEPDSTLTGTIEIS